MTRIEKLTAAQWRRVTEERERWVSIGACTEPADRATTEEVIAGFYRRIGREPPRFLWFDGPASCVLASALISAKGNQLGDQLGGQLRDQLRDQLWDQLWDQLGNQLGDQLWNQLRDQLRDQLGHQLRHQLRGQLRGQLRHQLGGQLRDQLGGQLRGQLRDQLGDQLWDQLWDQLGGQLWDQLRDQLGDQLGGQLRGQLKGQLRSFLDSGWYLAQPGYWVGHYAACRDVAGVKYRQQNDELLREWERLTAASGWWFPGATLCLCAERDERLRFDAERRLHAEDGPAILCRDGYAVYAWHGTRIPAEWITTPNDVDPKLALTWDNIEQRRCLAEIIGWDRVLEQLSPQTIDEDAPEVGTLLRVDLPDSPGEQFLRVRCGTGRTFVLPVPPDVTTARQANAWTYNLDTDTFNPEIRT